MKIIKLFFLITFYLTLTNCFAQKELDFFNYWQYYSDNENALYKHFSKIAFDQLENRRLEVSQLTTKEDWLERQSKVKNKLMEMIGPFPDKTPLNARVVDVIKKEGYRIEKIIYQSRPGYYVTSALYIPNKAKQKSPSIFYACGHTVEGFRAGTYQHIIVNLVKKGFVVFTIDPMGQGERFEYWDEKTGQSKFPIPDHEHSYPGAQCLLAGYSTGNNFIWDGIRGVDYMLTRKEIDPERIGVTGRSGGGNVTAYLGAFDDRVLATAPECYITSYEYIYKSIGPQCAEQNLYQMISNGLDHADFLVARAPKPTMVISTTRDFFSIQGTRDSFNEVKSMYTALDKPEELQMVEDDSIHKSTKKNREAMYAFFQKTLNNPGSSEDLNVVVPSVKELQITQTGQIVSSIGGQSVLSLNQQIVDNHSKALNTSRSNTKEHLGSLLENVKKHSGFSYPEKFEAPVFSGRFNKPEYTLEKYLLAGSGEYQLPLVLIKPLKDSKDKLVMYVHTDGMKAAFNDEMTAKLIASGYSILIFDLPGVGSMGPGFLKGDSYINNISYNQWFAAGLTSNSAVGLRAEDIVRVAHFVKNDLKEYSSISAMSVGPVSADLLHAAAFETSIEKICIRESFLSYSEIASSKSYRSSFIPFTVAGAIEKYDLADLLAKISPRKVLITNPVSADGATSSQPQNELMLAFPKKVYEENDKGGNLEVEIIISKEEVTNKIFSWLNK
jgi:hypothetical protein